MTSDYSQDLLTHPQFVNGNLEDGGKIELDSAWRLKSDREKGSMVRK